MMVTGVHKVAAEVEGAIGDAVHRGKMTGGPDVAGRVTSAAAARKATGEALEKRKFPVSVTTAR